MIVNFSSVVNVPVYFPSLDTLTLTVLLSDTLVAVISAGLSVQLPSAFWYSILRSLISAPSDLPATFAVPAAWASPL